MSPSSVASQERSAVAVAAAVAAAAGPAVAGVAAPPKPEKVFEGHGDGVRR